MKARAVAARGRPDMWALFPTGSFAAHSCEPNAYCRNHTGRLELVALRSIREGEAITLGIIDQLYASTLERRVRLIQNRLAFCYCSRCVGPVDETRRAWCPKCRCAEHGPSEKAPFVVHVGTGWLCTACESKFPEKMVPVSIETTLTQLFHKLNQGFCRPSAQQWTQYLTYLAQTAYQVFGPFHWLTAASHYLRSRYYVASINGGDLSSEALNKALEHGETYLQFVVATSPTGGMLDAVPWASTLMRATLKTGALDLFLDLADQYLPWIALLYGTDDPTVVAYEEAATLAQDVGPAGGVLLSKLQLLAICSERKTPAVETSDPESTAILVERLKKKSLRWKVRPWEKTAPLKRSVSVESVEPRRNSRHFARMACESNEAVGRNCKRPKAHAASRATHERDDEVKLLLRELREGLEELKNERATFEQERKALQKETESHRRKQKALQVHAEAERRKLCEETDAERAKLKAEAAAARELLRSESRARPKRRGSKAVAAKTNIVYDRPQFGSAWEPAETPEVRESGVSHPNEQPDRDRPSGLRTPHRQSYREPYRQPQVNAQPQINAQPQVNAQLHRQPQVNAQLHRQPQVHAQLHRQPQINAQGSRRHSQGNSPHAQPSVNALAYLHAPPLGYVHPQVHAQSTSQTYIPPMWGVNPSRKSRRKHKRHDRRSAVRSRSDSPQNCSDPTRQSLPQYHMPPVDESFQVVWMPVMPQMVVGTPDFYRRRKHQTESGYKKFLYSE
ncbi:MAG: uncharacterized protein KVP18_003572 [Porospora cf. gigantea A]|nr:MAG: hypothetical protein KVP18_003572 [Porospora cf. gigantea A]